MENRNENPAPLSELIAKLNLPQIPKIKRGISRLPRHEQYKLRSAKKAVMDQREKILQPYRAGKYKDWEGDGYFLRKVYLYNGKYYG